MKTKPTANFLILSILLMSFQLHGQQLTYLEGTIDYEGEQVSTFQVNLEPEPSAVEKAIDAWFRQNHDINLKDKSLLFFNKKFLTAEEVVITEISEGPINLVVRAEKDNTSLTTLHVFSSNADGFITPDTQPSAFRGQKKVIRQFIRDYLPDHYQARWEEARDRLAEEEQNRQDIQDQIQENLQKIEELKTEIAELESALQQNKLAIKEAKNTVKKQKKKYDRIRKELQ